MHWLVHESNLDTKISSDYKNRGKNFEDFKLHVYLPYKESQMGIKGTTEAEIRKKVELLEEYYLRVDAFNRGNWIAFQSKFRPTILEEFCGFLFKDIPQIELLGLEFFKRRIYAGLRIDNRGRIQIEIRDIDFCIGKAVTATIGDEAYEIKVPIVAIECKTYLDKTMLSGAQFTAQKLKGGTPRVKVLMIAERNEVDLNEIPPENSIDQIYILRGNETEPIDLKTMCDFFNEVKPPLERVTEDHIIRLPGKFFM